jgi:hypothetical protein
LPTLSLDEKSQKEFEKFLEDMVAEESQVATVLKQDLEVFKNNTLDNSVFDTIPMQLLNAKILAEEQLEDLEADMRLRVMDLQTQL